MKNLQDIIDVLSAKRNYHICVYAQSGLLSRDNTRLRFANTIHSKPFCHTAKSTEKGFRLCLKCKARSNMKAAKCGEPFCGCCPYGVYDVVYPVRIDGSVKAIIYIGNLLKSREESIQRIKRTARRTGVDENKLIEELAGCDEREDFSDIYVLCEIVSDYIVTLAEKSGGSESGGLHWAVQSLKEHADSCYSQPLSLKYIAGTYPFNEKYIGSLFKKQVGKSFKEYLNGVRLGRARKLLEATDKAVIEIALECGYENVTYFNRVFKRECMLTPSEYRRKRRK